MGKDKPCEKAGVVAAVLAAATTLMYVGPASAQTDGVDCEHVPTQIDIPNSILGDLDPTDLDGNDNGVGCEDNPGPPKAYGLTKNPPVLLQPEPEPEPPPVEQPPPPAAPTIEPGAAPAAEPVTAEPDFTG
jgi:hypothetical protein